MSDSESSSENPTPESGSADRATAGNNSERETAQDTATSESPESESNAGSPFKSEAAEQGEGAIRHGSPFAVDPAWDAPLEPREPELFLDVGPLKYTAMGAVAASAMVVLFASAAAYWFPGGGTLIAGLGSVLAIFGLYSHYRLRALLCLIAHLVLFMVAYGRALG